MTVARAPAVNTVTRPQHAPKNSTDHFLPLTFSLSHLKYEIARRALSLPHNRIPIINHPSQTDTSEQTKESHSGGKNNSIGLPSRHQLSTHKNPNFSPSLPQIHHFSPPCHVRSPPLLPPERRSPRSRCRRRRPQRDRLAAGHFGRDAPLPPPMPTVMRCACCLNLLAFSGFVRMSAGLLAPATQSSATSPFSTRSRMK